MDVLTIFLFITIAFLPLGELGRYIIPSIGSVPLVINDVLVSFIVTIWVTMKLWKKEKFRGVLSLPIGLFLLAGIISLLVNSTVLSLSQLSISFLYLLRWSIYAALYFVVLDIPKKQQSRLLWVLCISGQVTVGIGFLQYLFYPSLRNLYYLGWDEHLYRMFSVFLDPNFAGVFFVLVFLLTSGILIKTYKEKKYWITFFLMGLAIMDLIAIYLTYSRSALLMLIFSLFFFLWFYGKQRYIAAVFVILLVLLLISPKSFQTEGTNIFRIASSEARIESAQTAIKISGQNPLFGIGFNAYRYAQNRYGFLNNTFWEETHAGAGTDNSFLFVLATTGIVGISIYFFLLSRMLSLVRKRRDTIHAIALASFIGIMISSLFINSLFYIFIIEWLWILMGITENNSL